MNTAVVWTLCGAIAIAILATGFVAPSSAQSAIDCPVTLASNEPVEAGDGLLVFAGDARCAPNDSAGNTASPFEAVAVVTTPVAAPAVAAMSSPNVAAVASAAPSSPQVFQPNSAPSVTAALASTPTPAPAPTVEPVSQAPASAAGPQVSAPVFPAPPITVAAMPAGQTASLPSVTTAIAPAITPAVASPISAVSPGAGAAAQSQLQLQLQTQEFIATLQAGQGVVLPDVLFHGASIQLPHDAEQALEAAAIAMRALGGRFVVNGFASLEGNGAENLRLSWLRARVAGQKLVDLGVPIESLYILGHGGTSIFGPVAAHNRRVTIEPVGM